MAKIVTKAGEAECQPLNAPSFPDLVVNQIMEKIFDQRTILNCRLICVQWNNIIKNSSQQMKKITFPVTDLEQFFNLEILKQGNVKSIYFNFPFQLESENIKLLIETISNTVECIKFQIKISDNLAEQIQLLQLILSKCTSVKELIIMGDQDAMQWPFRWQDGFLGFIPNLEIVAANCIQTISIDIEQFIERDGNKFKLLILKLPRLKEIKLFGACLRPQAYIAVIKALCEYIKMFEGNQCIKRLFLCKPYGKHGINPELQVKNCKEIINLLILCGKQRISLQNEWHINLNSFLLSLEKSETMLTELKQSFTETKLDGRIDIGYPPFPSSLDPLGYLSFRQLQINFCRNMEEKELSWLSQTRHLESLCILVKPRFLARLGPTSIAELEQALRNGLPKLQALEIYNDFFHPISDFNWSNYFPNLKELLLASWEIPTNYSISELGVLEFLTKLKLYCLHNLNDAAFTSKCLSKHSLDRQPILAPAIACIKSMKYLEIYDCPKITDECVIDGISKCSTLKHLVISSCPNITKESRKYMKCIVDIGM